MLRSAVVGYFENFRFANPTITMTAEPMSIKNPIRIGTTAG